jgi:ribonuclease T2
MRNCLSRQPALLAIVPILLFSVPILSIAGCQTNSESPAPTSSNDTNRPSSPAVSKPSDDASSGHHRSHRGRADTTASAGAFDFYLLNLSWSPEFCATHRASPECGHGLGFIVHGLWPQYLNGNYPENCSTAPGPANPNRYTDIIPTASLVEHEWRTHGTCSGLNADDYFTAIRKAYTAIVVPPDIGQGTDSSEVTPPDLLLRFAKANPSYPKGSIAFSCGNNRLTAVEVCLSRNLQPQACKGVRSCRANLIKVTPK